MAVIPGRLEEVEVLGYNVDMVVEVVAALEADGIADVWILEYAQVLNSKIQAEEERGSGSGIIG